MLLSRRAWPRSINRPVGDGIFPPQDVADLKDQLHQGPPAPPPGRWTLGRIKAALAWLTDYSLSGLWHILQSLGLHYKRGRFCLQSPDPDYMAKRAAAQDCLRQARQDPTHTVTLYLDEVSYYRQPTLASCWWPAGAGEQAPAQLSQASNTRRRIVGALDAVSGQVLTQEGFKIGVEKLAAFYGLMRQRYPEAQTIYVIQDNWPVHFHPAVRAAAEAHRIQMVALPTYAPWLNPIEKFWRKLKQEVLHLHRWSDQWDRLQERVKVFLENHAAGSAALLRYVGLLPEALPV
jgi:transposase